MILIKVLYVEGKSKRSQISISEKMEDSRLFAFCYELTQWNTHMLSNLTEFSSEKYWMGYWSVSTVEHKAFPASSIIPLPRSNVYVRLIIHASIYFSLFFVCLLNRWSLIAPACFLPFFSQT